MPYHRTLFRLHKRLKVTIAPRSELSHQLDQGRCGRKYIPFDWEEFNDPNLDTGSPGDEQVITIAIAALRIHRAAGCGKNRYHQYSCTKGGTEDGKNTEWLVRLGKAVLPVAPSRLDLWEKFAPQRDVAGVGSPCQWRRFRPRAWCCFQRPAIILAYRFCKSNYPPAEYWLCKETLRLGRGSLSCRKYLVAGCDMRKPAHARETSLQGYNREHSQLPISRPFCSAPCPGADSQAPQRCQKEARLRSMRIFLPAYWCAGLT